jgi:L,D-transpeptidase YbiS
MMNQTDPVVHAPFADRIRVSIARQAMDLLKDGEVVKSYPVSTSKFGLGSEPGSFKTPLGAFRIFEKIGDGAPLGSVFKSRKPTGEIALQGGDEDRILSRILWLEGLDEANANTKDRYIYIHGTNQEGLIGTPASHGCVRMRNADVASLFMEIPDGVVVEIVA